MFITYILWGSIFYTSINIPYGSMASVISAEPKDRSSLSVFRSMGGGVAGIMIGIMAPMLVYHTDAQGNQVVSASSISMVARNLLCDLLLCATYFAIHSQQNVLRMCQSQQAKRNQQQRH